MEDTSLGMKKKNVQIVLLFYLYIPTFIQTTYDIFAILYDLSQICFRFVFVPFC